MREGLEARWHEEQVGREEDLGPGRQGGPTTLSRKPAAQNTPGCPWTSHWPSLVPGSRALGVGCWPQRGAGLEGEAFGAARPHLTPQTRSQTDRGCQCPAKTPPSAFTAPRLPPRPSLALRPRAKATPPRNDHPNNSNTGLLCGCWALGKALHTHNSSSVTSKLETIIITLLCR